MPGAMTSLLTLTVRAALLQSLLSLHQHLAVLAQTITLTSYHFRATSQSRLDLSSLCGVSFAARTRIQCASRCAAIAECSAFGYDDVTPSSSCHALWLGPGCTPNSYTPHADVRYFSKGLSTAPTHTITPPSTEADSRSTTEADSRSTTEADSQPTTASSQPALCGERLHDYPEMATPSGWMMCYALSTDSPDVATTQCGDLLIDLGQGTYPTQKELLDAGGNFGCFKTSNGITGVNPTYACLDNYQQTTYIATCSSCNGMGVCIRLP